MPTLRSRPCRRIARRTCPKGQMFTWRPHSVHTSTHYHHLLGVWIPQSTPLRRANRASTCGTPNGNAACSSTRTGHACDVALLARRCPPLSSASCIGKKTRKLYSCTTWTCSIPRVRIDRTDLHGRCMVSAHINLGPWPSPRVDSGDNFGVF